MKHHKNISFLIVMLFFSIAFMYGSNRAHAALVPYLLLSSANNNTQIQLTTYGADPNATIMLYYPGSSSYQSANIGTTNASGYLTTIISPTAYNISSGTNVYVMVDGAQSLTVPWPSYTVSTSGSTAGTLSLSQTSISLTPGQTSAISVSSSNGSAIGTVTIPSNTMPSVSSASVSGNQVNVTGFNAGSTSLTICASSLGCGTVYVSVSPSSTVSGTVSTNISFSQSSITLSVGQSQVVTLSGPGNYYISANSNIGIVSTSLNGSSLILGGVSGGTATVSVCSSGNNITSCGNVNITVTSSGNTTSTSDTTSTLTFSPTEADMTVGQTATVNISSPNTGVYYVSSNSNPASVTANINGNSVTLTGVSVGGANINICQQGYNCANLYGYVAPTSGGPSSVYSTNTTTVSASNQPLSLSSFSLTSNNVNNVFIGPGVALTVSFSANQALVNKSVTINGSMVPVNGSGNGPYAAIYTITGSEASPLPISVSFSNASGVTDQVTFSVSGVSAGSSPATVAGCPIGMLCTPSAVTSSTSNTSAVSTVSGSYSFTNYLYMGMTKLGVSDPDVLALQKRLTTDGYFSGPQTGYFGPQTKASVQAYQKAHGLSTIGVVGPGTRDLLNRGI